MTRLRLFVVVDYVAQDALDSYGTEDPHVMAEIDEENFLASPDFVCEMIQTATAEDDGTCIITVQPL